MGKQQKKGLQTGKNKFKKQYNNYNPYNRLELNKFHQIQDKQQDRPNYSQQLHKKQRDLKRMIEYRKSKGLQIEPQKLEQLEKVESELTGRKHTFQREKRKEFFIESKYKQIMNIQKRKIARKIREIKESEPVNGQLLTQWLKKLNYVKHYPKTLKYVSLFPNSPMNEKAIEFQKKIMDDIQQTLAKKKEQLNKFETQYKKEDTRKPKHRKDDFFLEGQVQQEVPDDQQVEDEELQYVEEQVKSQQN